MAQPSYEEVVLPARKAVVATYAGPRSGVGEAVRPLAEWAAASAPERVDQITIAFSVRPDAPEPPAAPVEARVFLELADDAGDPSTLPDGLTVEMLPERRLLRDTYRGPLTGLAPAMSAWLSAMDAEHELMPGYLQRIVRRGTSPGDSSWRIELALVAASTKGAV